MDGRRPFDGRKDTQETEAVISRTYENGKMRHMAIEIGLLDGWMCCMCLAELPRLPKLRCGVSC